MQNTLGQRIRRIRPWSVSLPGVGASWPFPRAVDFFDGGVGLSALGTSAVIERREVIEVRRSRVPFLLRVRWDGGQRRPSHAAIGSFRRDRLIAAFEAAGYPVAR